MKATHLPIDLLLCPLCREHLTRTGNQLSCLNRHCFDLARQGYVNLLPVQKKKSKDPGDSPDMVEARHRFLEAGYYNPIADELLSLIRDLPSTPTHTILDSGCGEGFYLRHIANTLKADNSSLTLFGLDISKPAIQLAARSPQAIGWLVGSGRGAPVQNGSLDTILCIFGFCFYADFAQILKPGGTLIRIDAGPDHLKELRERIYPELKPARAFDYQSATDMGFVLEQEKTLQFHLPPLDMPTMLQLMAMTPHLYRANKTLLAELQASDMPEILVDVVFRTFKRC